MYGGVNVYSIRSEYFQFILAIIDERIGIYESEFSKGKRKIEEIVELKRKRNRFITKYLDKHSELLDSSDPTRLE